MIAIYCQEILKDIRLFFSQPVAKFYDSLFLNPFPNLDLSLFRNFLKPKEKENSNHAMICSFIVMKCKSLFLSGKGIIDTSFIGFDSTPVSTNTSQNNPKSFLAGKFKLDNQSKINTSCKLSVHTASNQTNEKNYHYIIFLWIICFHTNNL